MDWAAKRDWAVAEHERRAASVAGPGEREDFRLTSVASASWAAGLASLMLDDARSGGEWLRRAADEYATSWRVAPPASWGRPIAMMRCRLIAGDVGGARTDAAVALEAGPLAAAGPIAGYCAALALLALGRDAEAGAVATRLEDEGLEPAAVAEALGALARTDDVAYTAARRDVLRSFEERDAFLEDVRVADTILVLDALARERGLEPPPLSSPLLPG